MFPAKSLPIVCYLENFIFPKNEEISVTERLKNIFWKNNDTPFEKKFEIWLSHIYSKNKKYLGYRVIEKSNDIEVKTYSGTDKIISREVIGEIESNYIKTNTYLYDSESSISRFYYIVDSHQLECTISDNSKILGHETFSSTPKLNYHTWKNLLSHKDWFCRIWDSEGNKIGNRSIEIFENSTRVDLDFEDEKNSQFEIIRKIPENLIEIYGSIANYQNRFKAYDIGTDDVFSEGGIILDSDENLEKHKAIAKKLNEN